MSDIGPILERLGLLEYLDVFLDAGFDDWVTLQCITEPDLEALNIKLGHRRDMLTRFQKLQREIAQVRGISIEQVIFGRARDAPPNQSQGESHQDDMDVSDDSNHSGDDSGPEPRRKRKYKRHPKADLNAPIRPVSGYVLFSNAIRDELGRNNPHDFQDTARLVGKRWQALTPAEKEPYRAKAREQKRRYNEEMADYKITENYRTYQSYLEDFKKNHPDGASKADIKRARTDDQTRASEVASQSSLSLSPSPYNQLSHDDMDRTLPMPTISTNHHGSSSDFRLYRRRPSSPIAPSPYRQTGAQQHSQNDSRHPASSAADGSGDRHPRRSAFAPEGPASFLRHDTTQSSMSSTFSTATMATSSSEIPSPITNEVERARSGDMMPSMAGTSPRMLPSPPRSEISSGRRTVTPAHATGYAENVGRLSISIPHRRSSSSLEAPGSLSHPTLLPRPILGRSPSSEASQHGLQQQAGSIGPHQNQQYHHHHHHHQHQHQQDGARESQSGNPARRMDALSVLAMAGTMVDDGKQKKRHEDENEKQAKEQ